VIAHRTRRCPLRQPRIWLWALAVALPAHIAVAAALSWRGQGNLVACPITTPLKVRLHEAKANPVAAPQLAQLPVKPVYHKAPVEKPTVSQSQKASQTPSHSKAAPSPEALAPAAGPAQPPSLGVIAANTLGFRSPPQPPTYPAASRSRAEEGTATILALLVQQGGKPQELKLEQSSGYSRLDRAALAAAAGWEFNPPPAPTWVRVPVRFALSN